MVLRSPKFVLGPPGTLYHLMIEARDTKTQSVQQYPLTLRSTIRIEQEENN